MHELVYQVSFNTPAFLGNALQQAQWRTPPFKALLRQWWRVVKARELGYDVNALRRAEGKVFGTASDDGPNKSLQSKVRLRLEHWDTGRLDNSKWPRAEIGLIQVGQGRVPADVYIGYGPVLAASKAENKPARLGRSAIEPDKFNQLSIQIDSRIGAVQTVEVQAALSLCNWFGGMGSRSRNGWGSLALIGEGITKTPTVTDLAPYLRPLDQCFEQDWPHAIGADRDGPLVWTGRAVKNWREVVVALAQLRINVRAVAKNFGRGKDISANQLIAYPVNKSGNNAWGNAERIASPLRLKVLKTADGLVPLVIHLPSAVPAVLLKKLDAGDQRWVREHQKEIWQAVHADLDNRVHRLGERL